MSIYKLIADYFLKAFIKETTSQRNAYIFVTNIYSTASMYTFSKTRPYCFMIDFFGSAHLNEKNIESLNIT